MLLYFTTDLAVVSLDNTQSVHDEDVNSCLQVSSADNLCKQSGPRSGQTFCPDLGPNCLQRLSDLAVASSDNTNSVHEEDINSCLLVSSADNLCKQSGPRSGLTFRSGPTKCQS